MPGDPPARPLRVGLVCPYDIDVPGGVREQVLGLARAMARLGEDVQVLAPRARGAARHEVVAGVHVVTAGPALGLPTNGSTARLALDPVSRRRSTRWALSGLDVLHVHEPIPPGIGHSVLRRLAADRDLGLPGPAVLATVHVALSSAPAGRSRSLRSAAGHVGGVLRGVDVLTAVSEHARRTLVDHLGRVPLVVPNAVDVASWPPPAPRPAPPHDGGTVVVLGRAEPRKGLDVLLRAWPKVRAARPAARLLVVGPAAGLRSPGHGVHLLGAVDEATKRRLVTDADVLVAPHRGGRASAWCWWRPSPPGPPSWRPTSRRSGRCSPGTVDWCRRETPYGWLWRSSRSSRTRPAPRTGPLGGRARPWHARACRALRAVPPRPVAAGPSTSTSRWWPPGGVRCTTPR